MPLAVDAFTDYDTTDAICRQRNTSNLTPVTLTGTYSGFTPTGVEYALNGGSYTALTSFSAGAGVWSGVTANLGSTEYALVVRATNDTSQNDSCQLAIGDAFLLIGDSTAAVNDLTNNQSFSGSKKFRGWDSLGSRWMQLGVVVPNKSFLPLLGTQLVAQTGIPIFVVPSGSSGSRFTHWAPSGSDYVGNAIDTVTASQLGGIRAALCMLGTNDASLTWSAASRSNTATDMAAIAAAIASAYSVDTYAAIFGEEASDALRADINAVRLGIYDTVGVLTVQHGANLIDLDYADHLHPATDAHAAAIAYRFTGPLCDDLYATSYGRGPRVVSAVKRSTTTVDVTFDRDLGNSLSSSVGGFRVADVGGVKTISSATVTATRVVTVTVSTTLGASAVASFASGLDATGATVPVTASLTMPSGATTTYPAELFIDQAITDPPPVIGWMRL
jgi:hypothetical protein